jgi:molybdopterin/thiamine biosynthesis adenylyltransferase
VFYRRRAFEQGLIGDTELWRAFDKIRLKVAAGGCGGCGVTADPNLTAMGIESFFVCTLLILHDLQESEKSENRS